MAIRSERVNEMLKIMQKWSFGIVRDDLSLAWLGFFSAFVLDFFERRIALIYNTRHTQAHAALVDQ